MKIERPDNSYDFVVLYGPKCGWQSEVYEQGVGGITRCPNDHPVWFIRYNAGEEPEVERLIRLHVNPNGNFGSGPHGKWMPEDEYPPKPGSIPYSAPNGRGRGWSR